MGELASSILMILLISSKPRMAMMLSPKPKTEFLKAILATEASFVETWGKPGTSGHEIPCFSDEKARFNMR